MDFCKSNFTSVLILNEPVSKSKLHEISNFANERRNEGGFSRDLKIKQLSFDKGVRGKYAE